MKKNSRRSAREIAYLALFAALMALCAWITIPFVVPFTMQVFAVLTAAGLLGVRRGTAAVGLYLALGAIGLPVFSGFRGGLGVLAGPTGGYLVGFLVTAVITGWLGHLWKKSFFGLCAAMALGVIACYGFGTAWYLLGYLGGAKGGLAAVILECVVPYLLPDGAKILLAAGMVRRLEKVIK